jgi:hypothetical protein
MNAPAEPPRTSSAFGLITATLAATTSVDHEVRLNSSFCRRVGSIDISPEEIEMTL